MQQSSKYSLKIISSLPSIPLWFFVITALVYFTAVRVDTMDVDASQYAEMSFGMMKTGDFLHLYDRGFDYLDKPPFLFWVSALSMKIFGANNFGYKFPSILFALWALYATYRLTKLLYNDKTARIAALVLATCQGMYLMTNDVRCDTILMSWVITAIWLVQEWIQQKKLLFLLGGCMAMAFGMMTKGPIALMVPVFCFLSDWILKREWKNFLQPYYIFGLIIIAILLIPMSIGLYQQYDAHPEKHISGLRFFFWSQSFGRITGESPWKNGADMSFLLLNMLWSFLPWIFIFVTALVVNTGTLIKQKMKLQPSQEWLSTGGFILTYLSLGSSGYQLPHYIFVAFPLASIVTGVFIAKMTEEEQYRKLNKFFTPFYVVLTGLLLVAMVVLITWSFPAGIYVIIVCVFCIGIWLRVVFYRNNEKLLSVTVVGMLIVNVFLTNHVYKPLLGYQVGNMAGRYVREHNIDAKEIIAYKMHDPIVAMNFYAQGVIPLADTMTTIGNRKYVLTMDDGLEEIKKQYRYSVLYSGKLFKVSELTPEFINPKTRDKEVKNYYIIKLD